MRHYEVLILINPRQSDQIKNIVDKYESIIETSEATIHRKELIGKVNLAYPIKQNHSAFFILMNIECNSDVIDKLKHNMQFNTAIIRYLITKEEEAITESSNFLNNL